MVLGYVPRLNVRWMLTRAQLACAAAQGIALLEGNSTLKYICRPLPKDWQPHVRFNDGACDSKGRFFAGSVFSREHNIPGQLWRYDPSNDTCVVVDEGPFTVRFSATDRTMGGLDVNYRTRTALGGAQTKRPCEPHASYTRLKCSRADQLLHGLKDEHYICL